jgi:hypothetical protein
VPADGPGGAAERRAGLRAELEAGHAAESRADHLRQVVHEVWFGFGFVCFFLIIIFICFFLLQDYLTL